MRTGTTFCAIISENLDVNEAEFEGLDDDELIDTVTTDKNGRVFCALENGAYYAVEIEAGEGYRLDDTPHYFEVENGKTTEARVDAEARLIRK